MHLCIISRGDNIISKNVRLYVRGGTSATVESDKFYPTLRVNFMRFNEIVIHPWHLTNYHRFHEFLSED